MQAVDFDLHAGEHLDDEGFQLTHPDLNNTERSQAMDATKIKVGDKVRLRNGEVKTVSTVIKATGHYPVGITFDDDLIRHIAYTNTGNWRYGGFEDLEDILEIIPASEKKIDTKVNLDNLKVGDTIKLTDGTVGVVSEINLIPEDDKEFLKYAHRYKVSFLIEDGTLDYWSYRKDGTGDSLDGEEIVEIIPAETSEKTTDDIVVKPSHYTQFKIEPVTFVMENRLSFEIGNIVKYACRAGDKLYPGQDYTQSRITDLRKVMRYAEMEINRLEGKDVL